MVLFEQLRKHAYITPDMQEVVEGFCTRWNVSPFQALLETHAFTETALAKALAVICEVPFRSRITWEESALTVMEKIPFSMATRQICLPISFHKKEGIATFVFADPSDRRGVESILSCLPGWEIRMHIGEKTRVLQAIETYYPFSQQVPFFFEEGIAP
jgi:hypothetical protein